MTQRRFILTLALLGVALLQTACASSPEAKLGSIRAQKLPLINERLMAAGLKPGAPVFFRVFKEDLQMEAWVRNQRTGNYDLFKTYYVCQYSGNLGPKQKEGDRQSPEGFYNITAEQLFPGSQYHLALNLGYPNEYDRAQRYTGNRLMIHGDCYSDGCYAMTDRGIEEIYLLAEQSLRAGNEFVPVHIFPFKMTPEKMAQNAQSDWLDFWLELKPGYDAFETTRIPPAVTVEKGRYIFPESMLAYNGGV